MKLTKRFKIHVLVVKEGKLSWIEQSHKPSCCAKLDLNEKIRVLEVI